MATLTQQEQQLIAMFKSLPPERRRLVMLAMVRGDPDAWRRYQTHGESELRTLAEVRRKNWDAMPDEMRQDFINDLLDENR